MAIPSIQAKVYCNLGRVISGQFADDYVQDSGLMKTRGTVELDGIFTIEVGQKVEFAFAKGTNLCRIPRTLRVMSSYADPFTSVTKVSVGCLLTYLSDVRKPQQVESEEEDPESRLKINAFLDPAGGGAIPTDRRPAVGGFITAGFMLETLLTELDITADTIPLENKYTKTDEDVSGPFVDKISDLLKSECFYGYLDEDEVLQALNLDDLDNSTGPIIEDEDLLSVDRIGSGELPGQAVYVRYQTRRLKSPDPATLRADLIATLSGISTTGKINWERSSSEGLPNDITVNRKNGATEETYTYTGIVSSEEVTSYRKIAGREVPTLRRQTSYTFAAEAAQNVAQAYWELGIPFANSLVRSITETVYTYDRSGNEVETRTKKYEPVIAVLGRSNLPIAFSATDYVSASTNEIQTSLEVQRQYNADGCQKTCNERWEHAVYHLQGQIGAYQGAKNAATADEVADRLNTLLATGLVLVDYNTKAQYVGRASREERPKQVERVAGYYSQKEGTGPIPERTETTLVYGNAESQRVIELQLPMSPDDTIEGAGEAWSAVPSVAAQRAQTYGKIQNRMRLGHREGLSIQIAPELMPSVPFAPIYIRAAGLTGQYRVNGSSWTFDANGIVCSIDAMFWGGAGQE
jgi:hypothetical protein